MGRGFAGYAIALALITALAGIHTLQLQHNDNIVATRVAMLEHQAITNKAEMLDASFCRVSSLTEWEQVMRKQGINLECGDIGPLYHRERGGKCDWASIMQPLPDGGKYVAGGELFAISARIRVGNSTGIHVIRSGTVCAAK